MASINGICVKGVKRFIGREGDAYQGNLYLGGKKIAFWSQDSHGGPDDFNFEEGYSETRLEKKVRELNPEKAIHGQSISGNPYVLEYGLERLLCDYIGLWLDEREYKQAVRAGYEGVLIATDGYHVVTWRLPKNYVEMADEGLLMVMEPQIADAKKSFFKNMEHTVKIYRTADDFNIGEPIALDDIKATARAC